MLQLSIQQLKKFNLNHVAQIFSKMDLSEALQKKLAPINSDILVIDQLLAERQPSMAIQFLALGLPVAEAIWWASLCIEAGDQHHHPNPKSTVLSQIQDWVINPDETKRQALGEVAKSQQYKTAEAWAAMAVFCSGGNIAEADVEPEEPELLICNQAVFNAIQLVLIKLARKIQNIEYRFLQQGLHIAMGGNGRLPKNYFI